MQYLESGEQKIVVQAPPGSGKTTLVPPLVFNALKTDNHKIVVTQPRRIAARAAAQRLQTLTQKTNSNLAKRIGYTVRGESTANSGTLVEFVTVGVLLQRIIRNPELPHTAAVILDEVHERSVESDLALALLLDVQELRGDLTLLALSATLDAQKFADLMSDTSPTPIIDSPWALHPTKQVSVPFAGSRFDEKGVSLPYLRHISKVALQALNEYPGDALVFVPGALEVQLCARYLREVTLSSVEVFELHGKIADAEQDKIIAHTPQESSSYRRIIVATNIAESAITVPGVRIVVDSGLSRQVRQDAARNMQGLVTVTASAAASKQRAGRAGRLAPGVAIQCSDSKALAAAPQFDSPEILNSALTRPALLFAAWGDPYVQSLRLLDKPKPELLKAAYQKLQRLQAVSGDLAPKLTELGAQLVKMPLDPELGRALLLASREIGVDEAATLVAKLNLGGGTKNGLETKSLNAEIRRLKQLVPAEFQKAKPGTEVPPELRAGLVTALAYPGQIAKRVEAGIYQLAQGSRATLDPQLSKNSSLGEWIAVSELQLSKSAATSGTGAFIRDAAPVDLAMAEKAAGTLLKNECTVTLNQGALQARKVQSLGEITLSSTPVPLAEAVQGKDVHSLVISALKPYGSSIFNWSTEALNLRSRLHLLHTILGEPWQALDEAGFWEIFTEYGHAETAVIAGI
ncbi:MAG: helicase-related protein, partial [Microbacteriaceae bacterium]|nr:helicase-related protein [Microbacteriaceae bacterium]